MDFRGGTIKRLLAFLREEVTDRDKANSCLRKIKYSEGSAQKAALKMMEKYPGDVFQAYHCEYCDGWHIGHPKARVSITVTLEP